MLVLTKVNSTKILHEKRVRSCHITFVCTTDLFTAFGRYQRDILYSQTSSLSDSSFYMPKCLRPMSIVSFWCAFDARLQFSKPKRLWQYYPRCLYRKILSASPSKPQIIHAEVSLVSRLLVSPRLQPEKKTSLLTQGKQWMRSTDVVLSICVAPEKTDFCFVLGKWDV